jgi:HEPN domain-containing protein/predicted nucleotidyltransferase
MKRSLKHLPKRKQRELADIVSIINEIAQVEMIVLFGSHARGDWVEDTYVEGHTTYEYRSDFDLLVIVRHTGLVRTYGIWNKIDARILRGGWLKTPATIIVHEIDEVNKHLSKGHYFFTDVKKEGILLYDSGEFSLAKERPLTPDERKAEAREDFDKWFTSAKEFYEVYKFSLDKGWYSNAAFLLHQATESFYASVLLVLTHYKPKLHDIEKLAKRAAGLDPRFLPVFPRDTEEERRLFNLLKNAYIDARYKRDYCITQVELEYLGGRVRKLQRVTSKVCKEKIAGM